MSTAAPFTLETHLPPDFAAEALAHDARVGLTAHPRSLPPKWFYDQRGSELFEAITLLPEYYPTRVERHILETFTPDIIDAFSVRSVLELGSGSSSKTRLLLDALAAQGQLDEFVMFDVSEAALVDAGSTLSQAYPGLRLHAMVADFEHHLTLLPPANGRLVLFLGSTIGNFEPAARHVFLRTLHDALEPGDQFLLGADLVKPESALLPAYDDAQGITAQFNLNVLNVVNRGLGADFVPDQFAHRAVWNAQEEWIEMRLVSRRPQRVRINDLDLDLEFDADEEIRTEISAKFRREGLTAEVEGAGFEAQGWWTDDDQQFSVSLWKAR